MTNTSQWIQAAEVAGDRVERRDALAPAATDAIFRQVLDLTYDPFIRFGREGHCAPLVPGLPQGGSTVIDDALREEWARFSEDALTTFSFEPLVARWHTSTAWPVYARVLSKRFEGVSFDEANLWGTLPLFQCAHPTVGLLPKRPFLTLAEPSGCRAIMVVRNPFDENPIAHWFHDDGDCITDTVAEALVARAGECPWSKLGLAPWYRNGIVYDGYLLDDEDRGKRSVFAAADIVPLDAFKEQRPTTPLSERIDDLMLLNPFSRFELRPVTFVEASTEAHVEILREHTVIDYPGAGVIALDPASSYPYHEQMPGWTWLREPK